MSNIKKLSENIKKERKKKKMTQSQLAEGICTQSQISKIEKNEIIPLSNLLLEIAQKLDVSIDYLVNNKEERLLEKKQFELMLNSRDYVTLEKMIANIDYDSLNIDDYVYIQWISLLINNNLYGNDVCQELLDLYRLNKENISSTNNVNILNSIGILYRRKGEYRKAYEFFEMAMAEMNSHNISKSLMIKVMYNSSNILFELEEWTELYKIAQEALSFSYRNDTYITVPELIYSKYSAIIEAYDNIEIDLEEIEFGIYLSKIQNKNDIRKMLEEIISK